MVCFRVICWVYIESTAAHQIKFHPITAARQPLIPFYPIVVVPSQFDRLYTKSLRTTAVGNECKNISQISDLKAASQ